MRRQGRLKRTPLKRKTRLRSRSQLNRRRGKADRYFYRVRQDREQWKSEQPTRCMNCGEPETWLPLQVHEIERRSHAPGRWGQRCNYLLLCEPCHAGPLATMPHAGQLALKFLRDWCNYDLTAWLLIGDPAMAAPERVTQAEVDGWVAVYLSETP